MQTQMDIEDLNKFQIVLLTLLVSFVTSIATGIVTVSLLDRAPASVTQTINKVVERTIETVVPQETQTASVVNTKETTVVVKEEDLITGSIQKNIGSFVKIYQGTTTNPVLGLGFAVTKDGIVVADRAAAVGEGVYLIEAGSEVYEATVEKIDAPYGLAFFVPKADAKVPVFPGAVLGSMSNAKLGQTVLALGGGARANVGLGIVSGFETVSDEGGGSLTFLEAGLSGNIPSSGTPLLNIFGEVIGFSTQTSKKVGDAVFAPADRIALFLSAKNASPNVTPAEEKKSF